MCLEYVTGWVAFYSPINVIVMPFIGNAGRFNHVYMAELNQDNTKKTTSTPPTSVNYNFNEITIE